MSMTGFGTATHGRAGMTVTVEARSVNNRFLKVSIRSPSALSSREHEIEAKVRERFARGTLSLSLRVALKSRPVRVRLNDGAVREYVKLFRKLRKESGVSGSPSLELLASMPGVFDVEEVQDSLSDEGWVLVEKTLDSALDRLIRMRTREGSNLKRDFQKRRKAVSALVKQIERHSPRVKEDYLKRVEERVRRLIAGRGAEVSDQDLIRELAIFAERSDVTEEVTRLVSHLDQFGEALEAEGETGRRLEFLVQEMQREANTIGSKSGDVEVSRTCVDLKVELDRLKEQVQNVE